MLFQIPKGLYDILPYEVDQEWKLSHYWQYLETVIRKTALDFGFKEIRTPTFERTEVFNRGLGEATDIVSKEMYTFLDKAKRSMTLRPEGTAPVMRSFIENRLYNARKINKFFYIASMFRYERPQSGRYRQHHQFGVEAIGNPSFEQDAEVIDLLYELYSRLNISNLTVNLNCIGNITTREVYKKDLTKYLEKYLKEMSEESKIRLAKNPLRILDSKEEEDQEIIKSAPSILDYLNDDEKNHFNNLCDLLKSINIPFIINDKLVRGIDYYTKTVFEITSSDLGSQNALGGGGRYDHLLSQLKGPDLPGMGFGTGLERILQTMIKQDIVIPDNSKPFVYFVPLTSHAKKIAFNLITQLRRKEIPCDIDLNAKKINQSIKNANLLQASHILIIGEDELQTKQAQLKNMISREQTTIEFDKIITYITNLWRDYEKV